MPGVNGPESNGNTLSLISDVGSHCGAFSKSGNIPEYKPKMNINLGDSTYTKTIDLGPQDFYGMADLDKYGADFSCHNPTKSDEPAVAKNGRHVQCSNNCIQQANGSNVAAESSPESTNDSLPNSCGKNYSIPRPTFFSKLARRLTIRRTVPKPKIVSLRSEDSTALKCADDKFSQVPTSRKIRRWLSKHLMPPKNTPYIPSSENHCPRAATLDDIDNRISQPTDEFGSAPPRRRGLPQLNLSESSLCNSQTGAISLSDDPREGGDKDIQKKPHWLGTGRLSNACVDISVPAKQDNSMVPISSALSSPSVTAMGPPPRYLNVSLAAFGYTNCNRKWVSAQALDHDKTVTATEGKPSSTFSATNSTPQRHKSPSPEPLSCAPIQRPHRLELPNGGDLEGSPAPQTSGSSPFAGAEPAKNSSGVKTRVRHNCSTSKSIAAGGEGELVQDHNRNSHSLHEHWNRSSLIMLAVAQASPRSHNAPSSAGVSAAVPAITNSAGRHSLSPNDYASGQPVSPARTPSGRLFVFGEESGGPGDSLPQVEGLPSANNKHTSQENEAIATSDLEDATASLTLVNKHVYGKEAEEEGETGEQPVGEDQKGPVKDGRYFLRVAEETAQELRIRVEEIERDLNENDLSDEVSGHLRTTVGKVNLLLSQKFVQFNTLCMNSIEAAQNVDSVGEFVTLPSDLDGFWAMVMLQVDDVRSMIASCERLRQNGWNLASDSSICPNNTPLPTIATVRKRQSKATVAPTGAKAQHKEAVDLARSRARERLKAAKRQYMRARQEECNMVVNNNNDTGNSLGENSAFLLL